MGFFDFLFEDNHRRPPRKKPTPPNGEITSKTVHTPKPNGTPVRKIQSSVLTGSEDEVRMDHFKNKTVAKPVNGTAAPVVDEEPVRTQKAEKPVFTKEEPVRAESPKRVDPELTITRNKILSAMAQDMIGQVKDKLGSGYAGLYAFDLISDASYTDQLAPAKLYEWNIKEAVKLINESHLGEPYSALLNTKEYFIYSFTHDNFVFNIFARRDEISEGILLHALATILND